MTNTMLLKFSETLFKKRHAHTLRSIAHRMIKQTMDREPRDQGLDFCMWSGLHYPELLEQFKAARDQEQNK